VLSTRGRRRQAGDSKAAAESANRLVEVDPSGPWGARGREILGRIITGSGGGLVIGGKDLLKIAQSMLDSGNHDRAIAVCHQALAAARGQPDEADVASEAFVDMGMAYWRRGWLDEAASAFDAAQERYSDGDMAPEGLWQAINVYLELNRLDKRPFYKTRIDDRMRQLPQRYPTHRNAAYAQLVEAAGSSGHGFLKAAGSGASPRTRRSPRRRSSAGLLLPARAW
jgi:tetratricopeptide (TPR) repeat protein